MDSSLLLFVILVGGCGVVVHETKLNGDIGVVGCLLLADGLVSDIRDSTSFRINSRTKVGTTSTNCEKISIAIVFIFSSFVFYSNFWLRNIKFGFDVVQIELTKATSTTDKMPWL